MSSSLVELPLLETESLPNSLDRASISSSRAFRFSESVDSIALEDCSFWSSWFSLLVAFANFSVKLECRVERVCWDSLCV